MGESKWLSVPVGIDAARWMSRGVRRRVLVVAHTVVSVQRLLDVLGVVEGDPRVQVVFSSGPDVFHHGVDDCLRTVGAMTIPWHQAIRERFDLALAAAYGGLSELHAPIMVLPHGAGYAKQTPTAASATGAVRPPVYGLGSEQLVSEGRVVPSSIILSHRSQRDLLAQSCPEAVANAVVAGDPCYDRLLVSLRRRAEYRLALGLDARRKLVTVSSTWGPRSLFYRHQNLFAALVAQLTAQHYRIAALLHPAVWFGHGRRQIRAWLHDERADGLLLPEPEAGWRAVVAASDYVIGDHGSVPTYAAAVGLPVLGTMAQADDVVRCSAQWLVQRRAPRLVHSAPIEPQLQRAAHIMPKDLAPTVAARLTSQPGQAHRRIRAEVYRLLDLSVPGRHRAVEPDPVPQLEGLHRHAG